MPEGCISRNAYDQISNKLKFGYEYLGEHSVKNITKPVRVYKVLMALEDAGKLIGDEPKASMGKWVWPAIVAVAIVLTLIGYRVSQKVTTPDSEPASMDRMPLPLPDKPSIAVLSFDNMSNDPDQEYFSDGISEDIITDLSKISNLIVIARNSSFAYKGKTVNVQQIGQDLRVRYLLEGSVRKAGDQLRIKPS
jgi:TolB-like protein